MLIDVGRQAPVAKRGGDSAAARSPLWSCPWDPLPVSLAALPRAPPRGAPPRSRLSVVPNPLTLCLPRHAVLGRASSPIAIIKTNGASRTIRSPWRSASRAGQRAYARGGGWAVPKDGMAGKVRDGAEKMVTMSAQRRKMTIQGKVLRWTATTRAADRAMSLVMAAASTRADREVASLRIRTRRR